MKFISNVIKEMKRVTWPTGKDVTKYTTTVVVTVAIAVAFFMAVDFGLNELVSLVVK